jgi:hypothetical protein
VSRPAALIIEPGEAGGGERAFRVLRGDDRSFVGYRRTEREAEEYAADLEEQRAAHLQRFRPLAPARPLQLTFPWADRTEPT